MDRSTPHSRHEGQLRNHSLLERNAPFHTSSLTAGRTFEANLDGLRQAVTDWENCCRAFDDAVQKNQLTAAVQDGTGPVAQVLGPLFNSRIGGTIGVVHAVNAYGQRLLELLDGLNTTAANIQATEANVAAGLNEAAS